MKYIIECMYIKMFSIIFLHSFVASLVGIKSPRKHDKFLEVFVFWNKKSIYDLYTCGT